MKAWVPVVREVKTTMESEKEEEKRRSLKEEQQEEKKKILSSLPPNYLTLNQLRENWMKKQQNEINQQEDDEEEKYEGNREDSAINRHAIGVDSKDGRKSVAGDEIGGGNEDLNGNMEKSTAMMKKNYRNGWKKRKAMKAKVEEKGAIGEVGAAEEKTIMQIESKAKTVDEIEQEFRVLSVNSGNGKRNRKLKKMNDGGFRKSQSIRNNRNGDCHGHGHHGHGHGDLKVEMIWVKKNNNVGEIES